MLPNVRRLSVWVTFLGVLAASVVLRGAPGSAESWVTTSDRRLAMAPQSPLVFSAMRAAQTEMPVIEVAPTATYQTMLGMGASLEHTTCSNLMRLPADARTRAIQRLVDPGRGIGMNLMRLCIGTSDFCGEPWYSYSDLSAGETDPELRRFSIERDRGYILPVVKEALRLNPNLLFFASPWSPPGWMKTTGNMIGGELKREWYGAYAAYFVKFIEAYAAEGIPIYAVTVQNEPGVDRAKEKDPKWFYPSCHWTGEQERDFIRDHLGPALRRAGLKTEIWCYDHNYNVETKDDSAGLVHPRTILNDPAAAAFVGGVAFHHYEGQPAGMTRFHDEFPQVPIRFTEGSLFSIWGGFDLVERLRHWATTYNAWVVMLDEKGRPNNGPFPATIAAQRLHSGSLEVEELFEFYNYGHFMKFIQRGAVRIASDPSTKELSNVAFRNPDGSTVVVVVNTGDQPRAFAVRTGGRGVTTSLPAKALMTLRWRER